MHVWTAGVEILVISVLQAMGCRVTVVYIVVRLTHLHTHTQFFDQDGDGIVGAGDLSHLPLHALPNPLPKSTGDYTGRYQNTTTTPTEMNFGNQLYLLQQNCVIGLSM